MDNGPNVETEAVVDACDDARLSYVPASANLGECGGRNRALQLSTGSFVCYLDDDDLLPRSSLRERVAFLEAHPECGMIYAEYVRLDQVEGRWRRHREQRGVAPYLCKKYYDGILRRVDYDPRLTFYFLKHFNFVRGGTPLIRREALDEAGGFDDELGLFGDYDLWLRLASRHPIRFLDAVAYIYRVHPESVSLSMEGSEEARRSAMRVCRKHGIQSNVHFERYRPDRSAQNLDTRRFI